MRAGCVNFDPKLLRPQEFAGQASVLRYLDLDNDWREVDVPENALAFTWCQVPIVYQLSEQGESGLIAELSGDEYYESADMALSEELSRELFERSGRIQRIRLTLNTNHLFNA